MKRLLVKVTFERWNTFGKLSFYQELAFQANFEKKLTFWETEKSSVMNMLIYQSWHDLDMMVICASTGHSKLVTINLE